MDRAQKGKIFPFKGLNQAQTKTVISVFQSRAQAHAAALSLPARPKQSTCQALATLRQSGNKKYNAPASQNGHLEKS